MKQRGLEIKLQSLEKFDTPIPRLEQYATPVKIAADILYIAAANDDIKKKKVLDLGCGNGIFAIGACLLGAKSGLGVDVDPSAIEVAKKNSHVMNCEVEWLCADVNSVSGKYDTCIQNPPFGSQNRHADMPFLNKAMSVARVIYTIHNSRTEDFVQRRIENKGIITLKKHYELGIEHIFDFHRKERDLFKVTLFRVERM